MTSGVSVVVVDYEIDDSRSTGSFQPACRTPIQAHSTSCTFTDRNELWFYYWGARSTHHFWHELTPGQYTKAGVAPDERATSPTAAIYLARLRLDGFVSLRAGATPGELLTKTIEIGGGNLHVNASAARGELRAEVRDADTGRPLAGYTLADAVPVTTDAVSAPVRWAGNADVSRLTGRNVKLRFVLERGDLYAFWFE